LAWRIEIGETVRKQLSELDRGAAKRILAYLRDRVATSDDPRRLGQPLKGSVMGDLWRYRVGDYRVIAAIEDRQLTVLVVRIAHRREVYR
jgi:mRNA interferase RelE/StbE